MSEEAMAAYAKEAAGRNGRITWRCHRGRDSTADLAPTG